MHCSIKAGSRCIKQQELREHVTWGSELCLYMLYCGSEEMGGIPNNQDTHVGSSKVCWVPVMNKALYNILRMETENTRMNQVYPVLLWPSSSDSKALSISPPSIMNKMAHEVKIWQPEFSLQIPQLRRKLTPESCPLSSTFMWWH